jgi:cell division protein FtsA
MEKEKIVVGLDIGTTKIAAIVGRLNEFGKLEVLGLGKAVSEGVIRGMVTNIDRTVDSIRKAIDQAEEQSEINIEVVNVGIAGQHIRSRVHHGNIIRKDSASTISAEEVNALTNDMYRTVVPPGSQIIHVMPQTYTVDSGESTTDPVGWTGACLEGDFHVITAQTNAIHNINKCIHKAGLEIDNLILEPIASSLSVLSTQEKEAGIALVDIGGGTTDIAIFHENVIRHTAVIPFGGNIITQDIKKGCRVMQNQAELLKTKFGKALSEEAADNEIVAIPGLRERPPKEISIKNLAGIIQSRLEEVIELVHNEILASGYQDSLNGGIVITGGGSQLQNIGQLFEYMTGMDCRIGHPNEHLGKGKFESVKSPMHATGVGLVLAGYYTLNEGEKEGFADPSGRGKSQRKSREGGFFIKILDKTKKILTEDLEDNTTY